MAFHTNPLVCSDTINLVPMKENSLPRIKNWRIRIRVRLYGVDV